MKVTIYGLHPVLAAISTRKVFAIYTSRGDLPIDENLPIHHKTNGELSAMVEGKNHQGIVCVCDGVSNVDVETLYEHKRLVILDGVKDPQNMGAIIRSAASFGFNGLIFPKNGSANPFENQSVAKASCGMIDFISLCEVTNLSRTIDLLKKQGFWIVGADVGHNVTLSDFKKQHGDTEKIALVMGGEESGMKKSIVESCDFLVKIPMQEYAESLNVSVSAAIFMYELSGE